MCGPPSAHGPDGRPEEGPEAVAVGIGQGLTEHWSGVIEPAGCEPGEHGAGVVAAEWDVVALCQTQRLSAVLDPSGEVTDAAVISGQTSQHVGGDDRVV